MTNKSAMDNFYKPDLDNDLRKSIFYAIMFVFYECGIMDKISKLNGMVNKNEIKKK